MKSGINYLLLVSSIFVLGLTGCSKKETVVESSVDFGELESTAEEIETTKDIFAVDDPNIKGYEIRETTARETATSLSPEEQESSAIALMEFAESEAESKRRKMAEALGQEYTEYEETEEETYISAEGDISSITDLGDGLVLSMRDQIWSGLIDEEGMEGLEDFVNEYFTDESAENKQAIMDYINSEWHSYTKIQESLAALPSDETFSPEELAERPEWSNYSRKEVAYLYEQMGMDMYSDDSKVWEEHHGVK